MARSVQIKQLVSDKARAEFLNFPIYLFYYKSSNLKIWRPSKYTLTSIKQLPRYELYTLLGKVIFQFRFRNCFGLTPALLLKILLKC